MSHWAHGGATTPDNCVSLCHRHHWLVHEGGWDLTRHKDTGEITTIRPLFRVSNRARAPAGGLAAC